MRYSNEGRSEIFSVRCAQVFIFAAVLVGLAINAFLFRTFISDDALISLRYAERLIQGDGLTWTEGKPVEGYSNLLWVLSVAALGLMGLDLVVAVRILGFVCAALVPLALLLAYTPKRNVLPNWMPCLSALLFYSSSGTVGAWIAGGLEQPLYCGLLAIALVCALCVVTCDSLAVRPALGASLAMGLMCITRPDGPIFVVAIVLAICFLGGHRPGSKKIRLLVLLSSFPFLFCLAQLLFRIWYYGEYVPNTAHIKLTPSLHHLAMGSSYVAQGLLSLAPFSFFALFSLCLLFEAGGESRKRSHILSLCLIFWIGYVILIGGDGFPAFRHFMPLIVIFAFALAEGLSLLQTHRNVFNVSNGGKALGGIAASVTLFVTLQLSEGNIQDAKSETWEWKCKDLAEVLKNTFGSQQPLTAVTAAGCLPYWSHFPSIDMLGLNDFHIARTRPAGIGSGFIGHEFGDGEYVLGRNPDLVVFFIGARNDVFRSGVEMQRSPKFAASYIPITIKKIRSIDQTLTFWLRILSPRVGIRVEPMRIVVPALLFASVPTKLAEEGGNSQLIVKLEPAEVMSLTLPLKLDATWQCVARGVRGDELSVRCRVEGVADQFSILVESFSDQSMEIREIVLEPSDRNKSEDTNHYALDR